MQMSEPIGAECKQEQCQKDEFGEMGEEEARGFGRSGAHHLPTLAHPKMSEWVMDARESFSYV